MRKTRFTDEQVVGILQEAERSGQSRDVIRRHGSGRGTFHRWRRKYGGVQTSETRRLPCIAGRPPRQRRTLATMVEATAGRERRACRWLGFDRSAVRDASRDRGDAALWQRLRGVKLQCSRPGKPVEHTFRDGPTCSTNGSEPAKACPSATKACLTAMRTRLSATLRAEGVEVPVLMLTARERVGDRGTRLAAGAVDSLANPFDCESWWPAWGRCSGTMRAAVRGSRCA